MMHIVKKFFLGLQLDHTLSTLLSYLSVLSALILVSSVLYFILYRICNTFLLAKFSKKYNKNRLTLLYIKENKLLRALLLFFPPAFVSYFLPIIGRVLFNSNFHWIVGSTDKIITSYMLVLLAFLFNKGIDCGETIYNQYPISKKWPIRSYTQFLKIVSFLIFAVIIISNLVDKSPLAFFTGLGAMMAIISIVFKDSILSFISSIQLSASNIAQVGHWVEIPDKGLSGTIVEMSLNTIKIQNFDNTVSTVPPYFLTSNILKNWQGMYDAGGRRFKRSLPFDMNSIQPLNESLLSDLDKIPFLSDYIKNNRETLIKTGSNLQLFRVYAQAVLDNNHQIHKDTFTCLVRELPPSALNGAQVEIYAFTKTVDWKDYEVVAADVMDHLAAQAPNFSLKFLQQKF